MLHELLTFIGVHPFLTFFLVALVAEAIGRIGDGLGKRYSR